MSYLKFDKSQLINLEKSLTKDMLRTNKLGAYSVTTPIDCNTSKYDGLLVVPVPEHNFDNYVLLSSLDETVIQHGAEFNMGIHKFQGNHYSPKGHKYIREFTMETVACTTYRVGGVVFSKERVFISNENRILIKYSMLESHAPVTMRFRPLLAFRSVNELTHENNTLNKNYDVIDNGIRIQLYDKLPHLSMQFSKENQFVDSQDWYKNIEYFKEQDRGYDFREDLYTPGYFELMLNPGESVIFSAGISDADTKKLNKQYNDEISGRTSRLDFFNTLKNAGSQFYNYRDKGHYIMAGYPWFKCRARDEFISLPGITLAVDNLELFRDVMDTALKAVADFMDGKPNKSQIQELESPDALLWLIWAFQQYAIKTSIAEANRRYGDWIIRIVNFIREGMHPNLALNDNGLLFTNGYDKPASWMNATCFGRPVLPRTGYLVEINALWYNALKFDAEISNERNDSYDADIINYQAEFAKQSFVQMFWNGTYLYDYIIGTERNQEVRPNMIFAVSLPYSPLDRAKQKSVVDIVTRELLTPRGLRTLSPKSGQYKPICAGNEVDRSYTYQSGTVWPWLIGAFSEAYLKIHKHSGVFFMQRMIIGFESEMGQGCIGTLNEFYDGNPPYTPRGAMSFAMSVAETTRTLGILKQFDNED